MIMKINKTVVVLIVLILWAVFSIGYVCFTEVNKFKANQMNLAFQQGSQQAIIAVANEANKCDQKGVPLNVPDKDNKIVTVTIVGVSCLQQAQGGASTPAASPTAPAAPTTPKK